MFEYRVDSRWVTTDTPLTLDLEMTDRNLTEYLICIRSDTFPVQ